MTQTTSVLGPVMAYRGLQVVLTLDLGDGQGPHEMTVHHEANGLQGAGWPVGTPASLKAEVAHFVAAMLHTASTQFDAKADGWD